eukprot:gene32253-39008_t
MFRRVLSSVPIQQSKNVRSLAQQRIFASPLAKKTIKENNKDLAAVFNALNGVGSGPNNRIVQSDVQKALGLLGAGGAPKPSVAAAQAGSAPAAKQSPTPSAPQHAASSPAAPVSSAQSSAAASHASNTKLEVPHYYLTAEINLSSLLALRERLNKKLSKNKAATVSTEDFFIKAVAQGCSHVPDVNASWGEGGGFVRRYDAVHMHVHKGSLASEENGGLVSRYIAHVDMKGLASIAGEMTAASGEAQQATGTLSLYLMGAYGIKTMAPIITPPHAMAVSMGGIYDAVVINSDDSFKTVQMVNMTVSCDHRVVDGAVAAQYIAAVKRLLEDPDELLL